MSTLLRDHPHGHRGVLFSMCLSLILVVASVSALNLALPDLAVSLGASSTELTWIADAYTVTLAALVLPLGALGDRLGRRRVLVAGTVVFGLAALAAAFATSPSFLIGSRAAMGLGAAMIMPGTLATITAAFPPDRRGKAVAVWSGFASAGAILGLLMAGLLLEFFDWQSVFVASAVIAAAAGVTAARLAPDTREQRPGRLDGAGAATLALAIGAVVYAIIAGADDSYTSPAVLLSAGVGVAAAVAYVVLALRRPDPLLDPRLFRNPQLLAGTIAILVQFLALFGFLFVGLQYLQLMLDYSPLQAALGMLPVGMVVMPTSRATPHLVARIGARRVMTIGLLLLAAGFVVLAQIDTGSGYLAFLLGLVPAAAGIGLTSATGTTAITGALSTDQQGVASALNDATREVGAALGIAIVGSAYSAAYTDRLGDLSGVPAAPAEATRASAAAGLDVAHTLGAGGDTLEATVREAFVHGMTTSLQVSAVILAIAAIVVWGAAARVRAERPARPLREPGAGRAPGQPIETQV